MRTGKPEQKHNVVTWQWVLFGLLQAFNLYQLLTHAMWRDELQTWSLVRESGTLKQLFHNMRYDGFPPLWYLFLWGLSFIWSSPLAMQLFHFSCSLAAQSLIMVRAPFSGAMKLAIVAGYYISFEYCIISRAYVLGVLLVFLYCALYAWLSSRPLMKAGILGLLANTSVYGAILSLAFFAGDLRAAFRRRNSAHAAIGRHVAAFAAIYGFFLCAAIAFMIPPADGTYAAGWNLNPDLTEKFYLWCRNLICLVPVPVPKIAFWNSLALFDAGSLVFIPVSFGVMTAVWLSLRASPRYLKVFIVGFSGIWAFTVVKYIGFVRHAGTAMVLLIACLWLAAAESNDRKKVAASGASRAAVWFLLSVNLLAWGMASYYHLQYDFSGSREMAQYIRDHGSHDLPIVADVDYAASSVAGYLGRPLYYATTGKAQTFIRWNRERGSGGPTAALDLAHELAANGTGALLLLNYPLRYGPARLLDRTRNAIVKDEVFYLYKL